MPRRAGIISDDDFFEDHACAWLAEDIECSLIEQHMRSTPQRDEWDEVPPADAYALTDAMRARIDAYVLRWSQVDAQRDLPRIYDTVAVLLTRARVRALETRQEALQRWAEYDL